MFQDDLQNGYEKGKVNERPLDGEKRTIQHFNTAVRIRAVE